MTVRTTLLARSCMRHPEAALALALGLLALVTAVSTWTARSQRQSA